MQSPDSTTSTLPATTAGRRGAVRRKQLDLAMLDSAATAVPSEPATGSASVAGGSAPSQHAPLVSPIKSAAAPHPARHSTSSSSYSQAAPGTASATRGSVHTPAPSTPVAIQCTQPTLPRPTSPPTSPQRDQQPSLLSGAHGNSFTAGPQSQPSTSPTSFNNSPNVSPTKLAAIQNQSMRTGSQASMAPSIVPPRHFTPSAGTRHQRTESNGSSMSVQTVQTHVSVQASHMTAPYSPTSMNVGGPSIMRSSNGANASRHYLHLHVGSGQGGSSGAGAVIGAAKRWFHETKAFFEDGGDNTHADAYDKTLVVNRSNDLATATGLATRTTKLTADLDFYKRELKRVQGERDKYAAQLESGSSSSAAAATAPPPPPRVAMWEAQAVSARERSLRTKLAAAERIAATAADAVKHDHVAKVQGMAGDLAAHVARTYMLEHQLQWFGVTPVTVAHPEYVVDHVPDGWIQVNERRRKMEEVKASVEHEYAEWLVDAHEAEARVMGKLNEVRAVLVDWMDKKSGGKGVKLSDMRKALKEKVERAKEVEKKEMEVVQSLSKVLEEDKESNEGGEAGPEGARVERQMSMEEMIKATTAARKKHEEEKKKKRAEEAERLKVERTSSAPVPAEPGVASAVPSTKTSVRALGLYEQVKDTDADSSRVKPVDSAIAPSKVSSSVAPEPTSSSASSDSAIAARTTAKPAPAANKAASAPAPVPTSATKSPVTPKPAWIEPSPSDTASSPSKPLPITPKTSTAAAPHSAATSSAPIKVSAPPNRDQQSLHIPRPFDVSIGSVTAAILEPLSLSPKAAILNPPTSPPDSAPTSSSTKDGSTATAVKDVLPPVVASKPSTGGHDVYQDSAGLLKLDDDLMAMIDFAFD